MRAYVLERLVEDRLLADAEFRERLQRLPERGRRLLLWLLEQQDTEREIQADDDITRREMRAKIAELRRRPVGPLSELEETVIREALASDDGRAPPARTGSPACAFVGVRFVSPAGQRLMVDDVDEHIVWLKDPENRALVAWLKISKIARSST